jgi:DNA-binding winged helix-turn-helix (wHTH) protein
MRGRFRFGGFELDLAAYTLRRAGERIKVERIPMEVLALLVQSPGTLVERAAIQNALWGPDVFVECDPAINTAVRKIRQALDDDADEPRFVETIVGKGYRFVAPVARDDASETPASERTRRPFPSCRLSRGRQEFALEPGDNLLGRDPAARVYVNHASVSRRHANISVGSDGATIEDLRSRNGTFLNGKSVLEPTEITDGSIIGLGPITLTFVELGAPASTRSVSRGAAGLQTGPPRARKGRRRVG